MKKPNFSVCLLCRNEATTLPRLVASLKEFQERGGTIHVLDTGSTDNSIEIAKNLGCKVEAVGDKFRIKIDEELANKINTKFVVEGEEPVVKAGDSLFDFASARNFVAQFSETDMIATPDPDEIFTKFDIDKIEETIKNGADQLEYEFVFSHDAVGNPVIKFRHCKFYNRKKLSWSSIIHEILQPITNSEIKRVYLGEDICKLEHFQNEKTNRSGYLKGLAVDCYFNPEKDRQSHYMAREMFYLKRYKSAIKEFLHHISLNGWPTEASQSALYIGDCYKALGNIDEMLKWYLKSAEKEARREPFMRLAEYYFSKNMHNQVIAYCEAALSITQLPFYSNHQPYYEHTPHELLYISYWWVGNKEKSKEHYLKALSYFPTNPRYIADGKFYDMPTKLDTYIKNIKEGKNFTFVKRGDGELACMEGETGANCDGHPYSKELGEALKESFEFLKDKADIVEWNDQANYNVLLHRKDNDLPKLKEFWMAVKNSPRHKVFVGPEKLSKVCDLLGAVRITVSDSNAFESIKNLTIRPQKNDIVIFSCGMAAKVLIARALKHDKNITCIDAGSSFDPIFVGNTRTEQASQQELQDLYFNTYEDPQLEGMVTPTELNWLYKTSKTVDSFLEIGSYKGKSTHAILSGGCPEVYAVDHFVGSSDPIETGNLDTYDAFLKNVAGFKNLTTYRMSSLEAVSEFADKSLDVVFIDGGHRIQEITEDIVAWLPKAKKILCGHDYNDVKAVKLAVDTLLGPVQVCDRIWYKVLDGTETLDMEKANKMARYLDIDFVQKMFAIPQETHPEKLWALEHATGNVIYDLGCGRHKTLERATGVDVEPVTDIQASIDNLPMIATEYVDTIISRHSLEHMADAEKTLKEWRRILRQDGKIVIILPDDEHINTLDPMLSGGVHLQAFTKDSFMQLVDKIPGLIVEFIGPVVKGWSFGAIIRKEIYFEPKISFVVPTLGREEGLQRCLESIKNLNYPVNKIEVIVKRDSFENRTGVPKLVKQGVEESTGDWVVFGSNDTEFTPDSIREALFEGKDGYVSFNTGALYPDMGNANEHFMIRKDIIAKIGEVFDTRYYHTAVDNLLMAKMQKLGIFKRAERAIVKHHHFTKGAEFDEIYKLGWKEECVKHDRELLAEDLKKLYET